jgi:hypothetical protein
VKQDYLGKGLVQHVLFITVYLQECGECGQKFSRKDTLQYHISARHTGRHAETLRTGTSHAFHQRRSGGVRTVAAVEGKMIRNPRFVSYCYVPNTVTNEEECNLQYAVHSHTLTQDHF